MIFFVEFLYFEQKIHRSPILWDLEFLNKSKIFVQNSKSKIPIVDHLSPTNIKIISDHLFCHYYLIKKYIFV